MAAVGTELRAVTRGGGAAMTALVSGSVILTRRLCGCVGKALSWVWDLASVDGEATAAEQHGADMRATAKAVKVAKAAAENGDDQAEARPVSAPPVRPVRRPAVEALGMLGIGGGLVAGAVATVWPLVAPHLAVLAAWRGVIASGITVAWMAAAWMVAPALPHGPRRGRPGGRPGGGACRPAGPSRPGAAGRAGGGRPPRDACHCADLLRRGVRPPRPRRDGQDPDAGVADRLRHPRHEVGEGRQGRRLRSAGRPGDGGAGDVPGGGPAPPLGGGPRGPRRGPLGEAPEPPVEGAPEAPAPAPVEALPPARLALVKPLPEEVETEGTRGAA